MTQWSPQQQAIFRWFADPPTLNLAVRARAGTGKTTTILEAVRHVPADQKILVCAFNKRIAEELQRKLAGSSNAEALTLHSLGFKFLRGAWGDLKVDTKVEDDRIAHACQMLDASQPGWEVEIGLKKLVSLAKGILPTEIEEAGAVNGRENEVIGVLAGLCTAFSCDPDYGDPVWMAKRALYAMRLALEPDVQGRISFDDMLFIPAAKGFTLPLYDWVIVDEAQDMNPAQLYIAQNAVKEGGHVVVVGDDRQAIYGFRGADSNAIDRMKADLCADELGLNTTYRCPKSVVEMAKGIVDDYEHAPWADDGTVDDCSFEQLEEMAQPGDVILSRVNAPLVPLCLAFIRRQKAARIEGRDIGKLLASRAKKLKAQSVPDFLAKLTRWGVTARTRVISRGREVDARCQQISDIEMTLAALAEDARSVNMIYERCEQMFADVAENKANMIILSTVHKAKGLEWKRVFLIENTFYFFGKKREDREEANIHYVAITRSQSHLTLVRGSNGAAAAGF